MQRFWRKLIGLLLGLALLGLMVLAFRPDPIQVDTAAVTRGLLRLTVEAEGKTRVRHRSIISTPVAGRLARIRLDEGDDVQEGTVVARIDPLPLDAAVQEARARIAEWRAQQMGVETLRPKPQTLSQLQARVAAAQSAHLEAKANVDKARAALDQAQRAQQRAQRLEAVGAIAREAREGLDLLETTRRKELQAAELEARRTAAEMEAARAELAATKAKQQDPNYLLDVYSARIASIEAELAKLQDDARRTEIRSPVRGQVLRVLEENERVVSAGTPLLEVGNLSQLEVVIDVLSSDAVKVQPGATVFIDHWGGDTSLQARVRLVEPSAFTKISALGVEEQRVNVLADFVASPVPLGDGYRVEARIVIWEQSDTLKIPSSALFRCQDAWCVFVAKQNRAQQRHLEIGQRSEFEAEVRHGLQAGEMVILHPTARLRDGKRIRPL